MGDVVHSPQAVGHGMAQSQPRLGEGHARHGRRQVDLQPHLPVSGVRGRKGSIGAAEGLPGQQIRHRPGIPGHIGLQSVSQHVESRLRNQSLRQFLKQIAVQDRHIRPQPWVHQGMLDLVMGQNGEIRHLRAGAGGSGNGRHRICSLGKISHGFGTVQGAAASQCHHQIGAEFPEFCGPLRCQLHRWVRLNFVKNFYRGAFRSICNFLGCSVFYEKWIGHQKQPFCLKVRQSGHCPAAADQLGLAGEFLHRYTPPFQEVLFPLPGNLSRKAQKNTCLPKLAGVKMEKALSSLPRKARKTGHILKNAINTGWA